MLYGGRNEHRTLNRFNRQNNKQNNEADVEISCCFAKEETKNMMKIWKKKKQKKRTHQKQDNQ